MYFDVGLGRLTLGVFFTIFLLVPTGYFTGKGREEGELRKVGGGTKFVWKILTGIWQSVSIFFLRVLLFCFFSMPPTTHRATSGRGDISCAS